jgi:hypothetical protein
LIKNVSNHPLKEEFMTSFEELVTSRKRWLNDVLKPWCQQARRADLIKAEPDWVDIAGKVDPNKTLWAWAWSRFPELVHESLGIEETAEVEVTLKDGRKLQGYPDSRKSQRGQLIVCGYDAVAAKSTEFGPFSIDDVESVRRCVEE